MELELSAGAVRYEDTGGEGPVIVLCHGLPMTFGLLSKRPIPTSCSTSGSSRP